MNKHFATISLCACFLLPTVVALNARTKPGNPVLPDFHADPEILYSQQTGKFYIYSTTDGVPGWGGWTFSVFSSPNLRKWKDEGVMLDVKSDQVSWANGNAWAPCIIEKHEPGKGYKYYFYYSANDGHQKSIGMAVADSPTGPFKDYGKPIVTGRPDGKRWGQAIDVDVFNDPVSGKDYLYWGNGYMAGGELQADMATLVPGTAKDLTPKGGTLKDYNYREAPYVFYRNGLYYFLWSVDDTGSPNYHVAYGTSRSPLGPIEVAAEPVILIQRADDEIYGTAHNSVLQLPGTDEWYIVYHRINKDYLKQKPGVHREVCIDKMEFNEDGTIRPVTPTHQGVKKVKVKR